METSQVRRLSDEEVDNGVVIPVTSSLHSLGHVMMHGILNASISTMAEIARTPPKPHGIGSGNPDNAPPSTDPSDDNSQAINDPVNNTPDDITLGWLSNFSNLPISDIYDYPGNDLMSAYLRFLFDLKAFPGSLNLMNIFWEKFSELSKSGKLNNPDFLKALTAGQGIDSVLQEIVFVKALMEYRLSGSKTLPGADFFNQLKAQFSGNDPISRQLCAEIDKMQSDGSLNARLVASTKSANQEWGDFVTTDDFASLKQSVLMTLVQRFLDAFKNGDWNAVYRLVLFLMMIKESDYNDQVAGQGQTANWAANLEKEVKAMLADFQDMKNGNNPNSTAGADFFERLERIKDIIGGSYLGEQLKDLVGSDFSQIDSLTIYGSVNAEQYYKENMAKNPGDDSWKKRLTDGLKITFGVDPNNPTGTGASDTQNSITSMSTAFTDLGQTLAAQIAQTTNLSKTQTGTAKTMLDRFENSESTAVKNQIN